MANVATADSILIPSSARQAIRRAHHRSEREILAPLLATAGLAEPMADAVLRRARRLAERVREELRQLGGWQALFEEYDLSSEEGVLLMCLAEALLRIPDAATQDALLRDKLARGDWDAHLGQSPSLFVNASAWGLLLTGRVVALTADDSGPAKVLKRYAARVGSRVALGALREAMARLARHFVAGVDIHDALRRSRAGARYSYDCLGEAARGRSDVQRYEAAYHGAIAALRERLPRAPDVFAAPGVSIKLSALHPRFEYAQRVRVRDELLPRVRRLALAAREANVVLTLDAEESERLELLLDVYAALYEDPACADWAGLGLAVQAYQKRALPVLEWLHALSARHRRRIPVRLVKGAYWDSEIKRAQQLGLAGYPVYTRKAATDVSYLAGARYLLAHPQQFYPQFATHNAYTVAYLLALAGDRRDFEFQRLHGMGEALYRALADEGEALAVRVYAPVGSHAELLPYLVRRLLENGANTSFLNQIADARRPIDVVVVDPVVRAAATLDTPHPKIPLPAALYGEMRKNSAGMDPADPVESTALTAAVVQALGKRWRAAPIIGGQEAGGPEYPVHDPADRRREIGFAVDADVTQVGRAFELAARAQADWDLAGGETRARVLERAADGLEAHHAELVALIVREGGRTIGNAVSEVREAVDACRYYAALARREFTQPQTLPGPTGEANQLHARGRGVFACVSPWNFPVAIFTGQVMAALAAGNAVLAKPARQTPLAAALVVRLLHEAGVPIEVLHFVPGPSGTLGEALLADPRLAGVALTGSTETAWAMATRLAERRGAIVPFIAETGGQNALIADSSALAEQLVTDVIASAFDSAGQRCSALRVLFLQREIADRVLALLTEAMDELVIGDPLSWETDIGPLIDTDAKRRLLEHVERLSAEARRVHTLPLPSGTEHGVFLAPHAFELDRLDRLTREVFGPMLHVVRYDAGALDRVIEAINATGYGLTLGVHSRIEETWERVRARARAGNLYVNRNLIGAVVGVQPFGGEGLSGTGPKAGGPHYLHRFATERTVTLNTAAIGGNANLLSFEE